MEIFIIAIYTIDAILLLWVLFKRYHKKMEEVDNEEKNINNNSNN